MEQLHINVSMVLIFRFKDGHPLDRKNSRFQFEDDYFHGSHQLRINKVVLSDAGRYAIKITNRKGRKMSSATLKVRGLLDITHAFASAVVWNALPTVNQSLEFFWPHLKLDPLTDM